MSVLARGGRDNERYPSFMCRCTVTIDVLGRTRGRQSLKSSDGESAANLQYANPPIIVYVCVLLSVHGPRAIIAVNNNNV